MNWKTLQRRKSVPRPSSMIVAIKRTSDWKINYINDEYSNCLPWSTHDTYRERDRSVNTVVP